MRVRNRAKTDDEQLEDIAAVDGVDALFIGPSDLAASLGHLGNPPARPCSRRYTPRFAGRSRAAKPCGSLSADEATARDYLNRGCSFIAVGSDTGLIANATRRLARRFTANGADAPTPRHEQVY